MWLGVAGAAATALALLRKRAVTSHSSADGLGEEVTLREISRETLRPILQLAVAPEQRRFVEPNPVSISQAHFCPGSIIRGVYAGETPVGFMSLQTRPELYLWRFMIGAEHQGKGYGAFCSLHALSADGQCR